MTPRAQQGAAVPFVIHHRTEAEAGKKGDGAGGTVAGPWCTDMACPRTLACVPSYPACSSNESLVQVADKRAVQLGTA